MTERFAILLMLAMTALLVACKDYGEFTVAKREWVDNDEFPALSELDLTGINLEFSVGSKAHARVLPEVKWPDPVGSIDFELPLEDGCLYVGLEPRYSRFRRIKFQGRTLLFVSYLVASKHSSDHEDGVSKGVYFEPRLAVIDESTDMRRHTFELNSLEFQIVVVQSALVLISSVKESIYTQHLKFEEDTPVLTESVRLSYLGPRADRMVTAVDHDGTLHLAWLTERYGNLTERFVYYAQFDANGMAKLPGFLLSDTATDRLLFLTLQDNKALVTWADARFISRGFDTTNQSKIMIGSHSNDGDDLWPPMVLNSPKDDSENAFSPVFVVRHDDAIAFLWGKRSSDSLDKADKQLGMFDVNSKSQRLATSPISHETVISTALKQQTEHQRSMPIPGLPVPNSDDCDNWQEQLNLKPTGFGIMTPEGYQPITRLDPEERDDEPDQR